ncbi:MAG TPA: AAA family ATPase [archaeon]|jgi:transitional endoplasmic reticulum ATPase|nr:AAA family ATPase [archaeon]HRT02653.1 AAA family ATPase [Candidatus Diapherotrites archaeon]
METIKLKVAEAHEEFVGKNIVTINIKTKQKLQLVSGDIIMISGKKTTAAQVWPEKDINSPENIIRMDQYIRQNAEVSIGEFVNITKIEPPEAQEIIITPTQEINFLFENYDLVIKKSFLGRPFIAGNTIIINVFGTNYSFLITQTKPTGCVLLTEFTNFIVNKKPLNMPSKEMIAYEDIGGLKKEIEAIREMVELPFKKAEFFQKLNVTPPKGVLLYGPPGTGKTLLAKALSNELKANFIGVDAPEIMAKFVGEAEERLRDIFKNAALKATKENPAIIFIDEIDAIVPKRDDHSSEVEKRVVAQLLASMDGLSTKSNIIVIGATNRIDNIDPALRRPGRFDREIQLGVPNENERLDILKIHTRNVPLGKDVDLKKIAEITYGYVGADLAALIKEAAINAINNAIKQIKTPSKEEEKKILENLSITNDDIQHALKHIQPTGLREVYIETPDIDYSMVGALKEEKENMKDIIYLSLKKKEVLEKMNIKPLRKILIYGPPGTGKTMFVKATAKTFGVNFIHIKGPEILDKYLGESEKAIRNIFKKAKEVSPCILFFDEIDALTENKNEYINSPKILDQLLVELDNINNKEIIFIAATNRPEKIDQAFLRSGRIDKIIEFKIPNDSQRKEILELLLSKTPNQKIDINQLVEKTKGFTGADLSLLITDAALLALKENKYKETKITQKHIDKTLEKMTNIGKNNSEEQDVFENLRKDKNIAKYVL